MAEQYRYVEVCTADHTRWRAVLPPEPCTIKVAEHIACVDAAQTWGVALSEIEVFVTRTVPAAKHKRLVEAARLGILDPDWWFSGRHSVEVQA